MNVTFYNTNSDTRKLRKNLSSAIPISYVLKNNDSLLNPIIVIDSISDFSKINYAWIEDYKRYYFVTDIQPITGGRLQVTLRVDPLMSHADAIASTQAIIDRSSSYGNDYIVDGDIVLSNKPNFQTISFPNSFSTSLNYVLIVNGY